MTNQHETTSVILGSFNAEDYLRGDDLAKLPAIPDMASARIVSAMDELLFVLSKPDDMVLTRHSMNATHMRYLRDIGYRFSNNSYDLRLLEGDKKEPSIFQLVMAHADEIGSWLPKEIKLEPFAVLPLVEEMSQLLGVQGNYPSMDVIKKVNSKIYSTKLRKTLGLMDHSCIVEDTDAMMTEGMKLLGDYPEGILIKDTYGVSGRGNIHIPNERILHRIVSYVKRQVKKGKQVLFILEPYYKKETDFSSQFFVDENGDFELLSVQKLINQDFAYVGSYSADEAFMAGLEEKGYFDQMRVIGEALHREGYYGDVCVDSMVLEDGDIYPMVEINARKSMSLIKHHIDTYVKKFSLDNIFSYIAFLSESDMGFHDLMNHLEEEKLLFRPERGYGILPLTANTLFINREYDDQHQVKKAYRGRFYMAVVGSDMEQMQDLLKQVKALFHRLDLNIQ